MTSLKPQNKNVVLHKKKHFMLNTMMHEKVFHIDKKKLMLHQKIFISKKVLIFFRNDAP